MYPIQSAPLSPPRVVPPAQRLIVALDVPRAAEARGLVERLGAEVGFYKIGLELFMAGGYFELIDWLAAQGKQVFADLKFFDVPETVARAVTRLAEYPVRFCTVHGNDAILKAAVRAAGERLGVLAVTVLTSLDQGDLDDLGFACDVEALVVSRARRAHDLGCAGVVCSAREAHAIRHAVGDGLVLVCPGIRPVENRGTDDQKRVMDARTALAAGADYLVVGRPIRDAADPATAARVLQDEITAALAA